VTVSLSQRTREHVDEGQRERAERLVEEQCGDN